MKSLASASSVDALGSIPKDVIVLSPANVRRYLMKHGGLAPLASLICRRLRRAFGKHAELCLQIYRDPEFPDRYLNLLVRLPKYPADVMTRIRRITDAFDKELTETPGWFQVTSDFSPPRHCLP